MYCVHKCNVALFSRHQTILFPFTETEDLDNYLHHADYPGKYLSFTHWHDSTGIRTSNSKATNPSKTNCEEIKKNRKWTREEWAATIFGRWKQWLIKNTVPAYKDAIDQLPSCKQICETSFHAVSFKQETEEGSENAKVEDRSYTDSRHKQACRHKEGSGLPSVPQRLFPLHRSIP